MNQNKPTIIQLSIAVLVCVLSFGCFHTSGHSGGDCEKSFRKANDFFNKYYMTGNSALLDSSLHIIDEEIHFCSRYKVRMGNMAIRIFILQKKGERGLRFVDSLDANTFSKIYQKDIYRDVFIAMDAEKTGNLEKRDLAYQHSLDEISNYVTLHPENKEAIADLFYLKIKLEDQEKVVSEIKRYMVSSAIKDSVFWEGLMNTVRSIPQ